MNDPSKPCLVDTGQGFSVLYHNRHLYSKYAPSRAPVAAMADLHILPESLILCFSPLLGYGLPELLSSLPATCFVIGIEADPDILDFTRKHLSEIVMNDPRFILSDISCVQDLVEWFETSCPVQPRRCISIDCSGAASLHTRLYRTMISTLDSIIATWWKNRMTLMVLGRNYHRNILRNLHVIPRSFQLASCRSSRPVLVAGAGPSLDTSLPFISKIRDAVFLIAVDTALAPLAQTNITPDALIILESQFWIEQALHGFRRTNIPVFADLTARPAAITLTGGPVSFFTTRFDTSPLLDRLELAGILPPALPRLGSVGLAAIHISRHFIAPDLPILFTGLDFSWGSGYSHSRGAPWPHMIRTASTRIQTPESLPSQPGVFPVTGKNDRLLYSNPVMTSYAHLCRDQFSHDAQCFDLGYDGLDTGCQRISHADAELLVHRYTREDTVATGKPSSVSADRIFVFLLTEYAMVKQLRDALVGDIHAERHELESYINQCGYLYSHFADAHRVDCHDQSFLNRIRVEAEVFLKTIAMQSGVDIPGT